MCAKTQKVTIFQIQGGRANIPPAPPPMASVLLNKQIRTIHIRLKFTLGLLIEF